MARQLNYARALVPARPEKYDVQLFQYQQPTSRLTHYQIQSENQSLPAVKARELSIVQEYRISNRNSVQNSLPKISTENTRQVLFSKQESSIFYTKSSSEKIKDGARRNNIDYLYKFVDIIEKDFLTLLSDSRLTHRSLKYLQSDVQTVFNIEHYKTLRTLGVLPNKDVLVGRKAFADAVDKSIYHLKLLHTDCHLSVEQVKPIPEKLQVEIRYTFRGMTRLPKNEVIIDFLVKFSFSKNTKKVFQIEFTDKHIKDGTNYGDVFKGIGLLAMPLFGLSDNIGLIEIDGMKFDRFDKNYSENL